MTAGPTATRKNDGNKQSTSGKIILVLIFAACSSADCVQFVTKLVGIDAQRIRHTGPEPHCLHEQGSQAANVLQTSAIRQVLERLSTLDAGANLGVDEPKLLTEFRVTDADLIGNPLQGRCQAEARFDADHQEVERVRKRRAECSLSEFHGAIEPHAADDRAKERAPVA